jgi:hypothetical protein
MIQTLDWVIVSGILFLFSLSGVYLIYVLVRSKLFPQTLDFHKEINPNENATISSIEGSGIVKKIKISIAANNQSLVTLITDRTRCMDICLDEKKPCDDILNKDIGFEINLDKKFGDDFAIFFQNQGGNSIQLDGNIYFEIRKSLSFTLRTLFSELFFGSSKYKNN